MSISRTGTVGEKQQEAIKGSFELKKFLFDLIPSFLLFQLGDTGTYTCIASTPSGEATWKAYLEVHGKPE